MNTKQQNQITKPQEKMKEIVRGKKITCNFCIHQEDIFDIRLSNCRSVEIVVKGLHVSHN